MYRQIQVNHIPLQTIILTSKSVRGINSG